MAQKTLHGMIIIIFFKLVIHLNTSNTLVSMPEFAKAFKKLPKEECGGGNRGVCKTLKFSGDSHGKISSSSLIHQEDVG